MYSFNEINIEFLAIQLEKYYICELIIIVMTYTELVEATGDGLLWTTSALFENIGNIFNYGVIVLGFVGLFIWLRLQAKYNKEAANDPTQIK